MNKMSDCETLQIFTYIFGGIVIIENIVFILFGIKSPVKKTHNLFVLCLNVADGLHAASTISIIPLLYDKGAGTSHSIASNVTEFDREIDIITAADMVRLISYFGTLGISISFMLVISIERFVTVRRYNYFKTNLGKKKHLIVAIPVALVLAYTSIIILTASIKAKVVTNGIVHMLGIKGTAIAALYIALVVANITIYGRTSRSLWKIFKKPSMTSHKKMSVTVVAPARNDTIFENSHITPDMLQMHTEKDNVIKRAISNPLPNRSKSDSSCVKLNDREIGSLNDLDQYKGRRTSLWKLAKEKVMKNRVTFELDQTATAENSPKSPNFHNPSLIKRRGSTLWKTAKEKVIKRKMSSTSILYQVKPSPSRPSVKEGVELTLYPEIRPAKKISSIRAQRTKSSSFINAWERRAFVTNIVLIIDHILFLFPFMTFLPLYMLMGDFNVEILNYGILWMMVHFLANPVIFGWRTHGMHNRMKQALSFKNQIIPDPRKPSYKGRSFSLTP